jgi:hypothetical protein
MTHGELSLRLRAYIRDTPFRPLGVVAFPLYSNVINGIAGQH